MSSAPITPYPALDTVLHELVSGIQQTLGANFIGAYLQGSFALGAGDEASDVDFLVAIEEEVAEMQLAALQTMHARIYALDIPWAQHLEGSYFSRHVLRRFTPTAAPLLYLDNCSRELIRSRHDDTLVVRWMTREHGITLAGPDTKSLIDPVPTSKLRQEVWHTMREWGAEILSGRYQMQNRWAQPFVVLSYCRMLQTLATGTIQSKPAAVRWAQSALDHGWGGLIQRAWDERPDPSAKVRQAAEPDAVQATLDFIGYALKVGQQSGQAAETRP